VISGRAAQVHSSLLTTTAKSAIEVKCAKPDFRVSICNLCSQGLSPVAVCFWGRLRIILLLKYTEAQAAALGLHLFLESDLLQRLWAAQVPPTE